MHAPLGRNLYSSNRCLVKARSDLSSARWANALRTSQELVALLVEVEEAISNIEQDQRYN